MEVEYILGIYPRIPKEQADLLNGLDTIIDREILSSLNLSSERVQTFLDVLKENIPLDAFIKLDIQLYALKCFFPEDYKSLSISEHIYSKADNYEYDPAKNGQNIIKHGLSFSEVVSYSSRFGTLLVPCPDVMDSTRHVIFSDLSLSKRDRSLYLPLNKEMGSSEVYTLSIAQSINGKFRFISSRVMSRTRFAKNMKNAFRGIYDNEPEKKKEFVSKCVRVLRRDLFKTNA